MVNAKNVAAKVIVSLAAVGSLGVIAGAGPLAAVAQAAPPSTSTTPTSSPSTTPTSSPSTTPTTKPAGPSTAPTTEPASGPSAKPAGHAGLSTAQQACREHRRSLGYLAKAHSHAAARTARLKAQSARAQKAGHAKLAQFWQRSAVRHAAALTREQGHLSKRTAAVAKGNAKLKVTC